MRHQEPTCAKPRWLIYAAKVKARIDRLRHNRTYQERRDEEVYRSYHAAKEKHHYAGTLGDWAFIVEEMQTPPTRKSKC